MAGKTIVEKIIARASGVATASAGDIVVAAIDFAMMDDSGGPRRVQPILNRLHAELFDPQRIVVVSDHFAPGETDDAREILSLTRQWARDRGITHYDAVGICHVVAANHGHVRPGMFAVGGDSHSTTGGAF